MQQNYNNETPWNTHSILNGRVNAIDDIDNNFNIKSYNQIQSEDPSNITSRNISNNCVSDLLFSKTNIDALQIGLRNKVYNESNGELKIGNQSVTELKIIMRSIYLQYSKNNPDNIIDQVKQLNKLILEWAVPEIISNIKQFKSYTKDISALPVPLERSQLTSQKGTRVLEIKTFM